MPWPHLLLALAVVAVWGSNFVVIRVALDVLPPLLLAALRFALAVLPALFFLQRPAVPWRNLAAYGLCIGAGQFGLLYVAMDGRISPGLASLVIQVQVFFTIGLAMWFGAERVQRHQWLALLLAVSGIAVIGAHAEGSTTGVGLALVLLAAASWAWGNHTGKLAARHVAGDATGGRPPLNALAYVVWSSAFAVPPLLLASLLLEGPDAIRRGLQAADAVTWASVAWQAWANSLFGYAAWGWLLARHPAATVTPLALGIPVFGMASSALWLEEALPFWKLAAAGLVLSGLALNMLWPHFRHWMKERR